MELVTALPADLPLTRVADLARRAESLGFDVLHVPETVHDPFVMSALALEHTSALVVRTSMVVAFARSPMVTALSAWDLAGFSGGRFQLGVASQVRGNIVGRFSAVWENPVTQLRDYVGALRAIFTSFETGAPLRFDGRHYRFDRLQPYFTPAPLRTPPPSIWMGGVGEQMLALAGEVADGLVCHPTASHPRLIAERTAPAVAVGIARAGRVDGGPRLIANARPITGRTQADVARARAAQLREFAFLYTTPAYRGQLELFGLAGLGERLHAMAADDDWSGLEAALPPEVLDVLVPQGTYDELPAVLRDRYAGRCDGLNIPLPADPADDGVLAAALDAIRTIPTRTTAAAAG